MKFRAAALLAFAVGATAEDLRVHQRADGGYDFFDFSGVLISNSTPNDKGSYDFRDLTGRLTGWADARSHGQIHFHDATGAIYRTVHLSSDQSAIITSDLGKIYNFSIPNYRGGTDNFNIKGEITSYTLGAQLVMVRPDDDDKGP